MNFMERALGLARLSLGLSSPNPAVGAVIVRDGTVVGEGHTRPPGLAHAEAVALDQAGEAVRGAVLYTTLEPCCITGRTPPCTQAIIRAGIGEVHIATLDPNPTVHGNGLSELQRAGVKTSLGEREQEAQCLIEAYSKFITTGRPFVTAKFAASLDGKIATRSGQSQWITGEEARQRAHLLRGLVDAVLVGAGTVQTDNPRLTARRPDGLPNPRQPARVVVDSKGRCSADSQVFAHPGRSILAACRIDDEKRVSLERLGVEVLITPPEGEGVDLDALLDLLAKRDFTHLLVEGGGALLGSFFDRMLVDKVVAFVATAIIGGCRSVPAVGGLGADVMSDVLRLRDVEMEQLGPDIMVTGYP